MSALILVCVCMWVRVCVYVGVCLCVCVCVCTYVCASMSVGCVCGCVCSRVNECKCTHPQNTEKKRYVQLVFSVHISVSGGQGHTNSQICISHSLAILETYVHVSTGNITAL